MFAALFGGPKPRGAALLTAALALAACKDPIIYLEDANNFSYVGTVDVPSVATADASDLEICWDQLLQDIQCHDLDAAQDIDWLSLVRFGHLSQEEVEQKLNDDNLLQSDQSGYVEYENEDASTCVSLSDFSFMGTPVDVPAEYNSELGTFMVLLSTGDVIGVGTRMLLFLEPTPKSKNTAVEMPDGCGVLDFSADLQSLEPVVVPREEPWSLDWWNLTTNGLGNAMEHENIDGLMLGFYEGMSAQDLQEQFLDLQLITDQIWTMDIDGGATAELSEADNNGSAFTGFEGNGTWVLAMTCSRCANPAPLFLTLLEPEEE